MKLGVATVGLMLVACSSGNAQYARDLQGCIHAARVSDAGSDSARLAFYNACADALDAPEAGVPAKAATPVVITSDGGVK